MGYDEARFIAQNIEKHALTIVATGTFTASDHVLTSTPVTYHALVNAAILTGASAVVATAGVSKVPVLYILQGTTIGGSLSISHTLGAVGLMSSLTNTVTFSAGEVPVIKVVHTGTASATQIVPVLNISLKFREQFV